MENQPRFPSKRIELHAVVGKGEEDRISELPDCLLFDILSRLCSIKGAARTGTLSKRWKHLWTWVPTDLSFDDYNNYDKIPWSDFVSFVDKILAQCYQLKLKKFELYTHCESQHGSQVNNWIHYAIRRNVEELNLIIHNMRFEAWFELDQFFSNSSCFTHLRLGFCKFNPIGPISWKNLRYLRILRVYLDGDLIKNILCGTPKLETLQLEDCYGYRRLDITSKSVKNLVFSGYRDPRVEDIIEINAPNILSLTIEGHVRLRKLFLVNVSCVVEANLDYIKYGPHETTKEEAEEVMLKGFILNFRHVKELKIGRDCFKVLRRLEAKGFVCPVKYKVSLSRNWSVSDESD